MRRRLPAVPLGLIGRIVAILLLTIVIEFGVSVLLYERASQFSVRDDEARRLAEHLVIARRIVDERPVVERAGMAAELTTDRPAGDASVRCSPVSASVGSHASTCCSISRSSVPRAGSAGSVGRHWTA